MKDRQPTQVLANGAIRYGVYNADGTLNHYEYLKREDAPTVEGTPLNKANLLSDTTAAKLSAGQCALIAATLPNPIRFDSAHPSSYILKRQGQILRLMKLVAKFPPEKTAVSKKKKK